MISKPGKLLAPLEPIGIFESCFRDKFGVPRQPGLVPAATGKLKIRADLQPEQALVGLQGFSHLWLIWVFHQNRVARYHSKVHPPRLEGQSQGLFATRSPHRPNPIGLSLVEIIKVEGDTIWVAGADLMDGTPVLDVKPYLPEIESKPEAKTGWTTTVERPQLRVTLSPEARGFLQAWQQRYPTVQLYEIITQTIALDPRPEIYRGSSEGEGWQRRPNHAFRLLDGDIHFRMTGAQDAEVFQILMLEGVNPPMNLHKFAASISSLEVHKPNQLLGRGDGNND